MGRSSARSTADTTQMFYDWASEQSFAVLEWATSGSAADKARARAIIDGPTQDWPLANLGDALAIAIAYVCFVLFMPMVLKTFGFGPKAFRWLTRPIQFVYNPVQVALCGWMVIETVLIARRNDYALVGNKFDPKDAPMANILWVFYVSKVLDFVDTFCIVLNQKWSQLSFLHVYHHITIFLIYWLNLRVGYDGDIYLTIILNGFVHFVMYTYYFISMHGDQIAAKSDEGKMSLSDLKEQHGVVVTLNIWWKKYLTMVQMIQFLCMNAQALMILFVVKQPEFPRHVIMAYLVYIQSLFWLFFRFFIKSYSTKKSKKE